MRPESARPEVIVGVIGILILAETCRRVVGIPILCVATFFMGYAFYNGLGQGRDFAVVLKIHRIQPVLYDRRCYRYSDRCLLDVHRTVYPVRRFP